MLLRHMHKLGMITVSISLASIVHAAPAAGFYFGGEAGYANTQAPVKTITTDNTVYPPVTEDVTPSGTGATGRVYLGYNFTPYAGVEWGASLYPSAKYNVSISGSCDNPSVDAYGTDLDIKGVFSLSKKIDLFGKAGIAAVLAEPCDSLETQAGSSCQSTTKNSIAPLFAVGLGYNLNQNVEADLTFTHIMVSGSSFINKIDTVTLGFSYHFVDTYCGQFLC